jgi:hypothetical protein
MAPFSTRYDFLAKNHNETFFEAKVIEVDLKLKKNLWIATKFY